MLTFTISKTTVSGVGVMVTLCYGRCCDHCNYRQMLCLLLWQMLLPLNLVLLSGRWYATEADVIAFLVNNDRCYCHVADEIATLGLVYFNLSPEMLNRSSSHI